MSASPDASLHGLKPWQTWQQVWADIHRRFALDQFSALVLSGDLSNDETEASYRQLAHTLTQFPGKVIYLPGNHDNYEMMQCVFVRAGLPSSRLLELGDWVFIGLNTQLPGKVYGQLAATELQWLDNCLRQYAHKKIVIFTHHHILRVPAFRLDAIRLKNAKALLKIIDAHHNVKAVLNGHIHQANEKLRNGVQYLATPATCIQFKPTLWTHQYDTLPPGYRVIDCKDVLSSRVYYAMP